MAVATSFKGSGKFVPVREWSCPYHDQDVNWGDEERQGEWCNACEAAGWKTAYDELGEPILREVGMFEALLMDMSPMQAMGSLFARPLVAESIKWLEDDLMPGTKVFIRSGE